MTIRWAPMPGAPRLLALAVPLVAVLGCARTNPDWGAPEPPVSGQLAANRLYGMAEESFERGNYEQSVGLFRQAFLVRWRTGCATYWSRAWQRP